MKRVTVILTVLLLVVSAACITQAFTISRMVAERKALVEYVGNQEMNGYIVLNDNVRIRLFDFSPEAEF